MITKGFMPMHLQFFAEDTGASDGTDGGGASTVSDVVSLDTLLDGAKAGTNTEPGSGPADAGTTDDGGTTDEGGTQPTTTQKNNAPNKTDHAFAEMRTQNNTLIGLLGKIAKANGIDFKDNHDLLSKLSDDAINKLAQKQNVPVELLQRLETLENTGKLYEEQQRNQAALLGFQKVKDDYKLTDDELRGFAEELDEADLNPFAKDVNVALEYQTRHMEDIVNKRVQAAVEAALKKSSAADQHGSTPNNASGKPDTGAASKVSTITALNEFLDNKGK